MNLSTGESLRVCFVDAFVVWHATKESAEHWVLSKNVGEDHRQPDDDYRQVPRPATAADEHGDGRIDQRNPQPCRPFGQVRDVIGIGQ